jgi:SAM-dependent methyltransferase
MSVPATSKAEFFEAKYVERADPWDFAGSPYELGRYDAIIAALDHRRYRRVFEPGCSIGILTRRLTELSDSVVAIDFSATAVAQALTRCRDFPGVEMYCASLPEYIPALGQGSRFDLIVLSEIGYYFRPHEWESLTARIVESMEQGAILLAAHWLGDSIDHQMTGDAVHEILNLRDGLQLEHSERHGSFRIDRWVRA